MKPNVLVVQDDAEARKAVASVLESNHHSVIPASNVQDGLFLAPQADVILLDMKQGRETADAFLESLKKIGCYTPVIIVSGVRPRQASEDRLGKYRIVDFIEKPFKSNELLEKVSKAERISGALASTCEAADRFSAATNSLRALTGKSITEIGKSITETEKRL